jgi:membrane fusion protein (multidrug efflux system)
MNKKYNPSRFNTVLVVFAWIMILAGVIIAVKYYFFASEYVTTNNAQVDQYVTPIASRVSGFIKEIRFAENQYVHKGDTLVVLDGQEYANKLQMAESDMQVLKGQIAVSQKTVRTAQNRIAVQKARLEAAKAKVWQSEENYKRFKNLLKEDAATSQQYEAAKATYEVSLADYKAIQNEQKAADLSSQEESSKVKPIESNVEQKKALLQNAALYISYTVITAPYNGWIGRKSIQVGQLVKEGETLLNIVSEEKWVTANFRETQIAPLHVGSEVLITADAYPDVEFVGVIESFSPASGAKFSLLPQDNSTGNFVKIEQRIPMRIKFDNGQDNSMLRAGMNVLVNARRDNKTTHKI